MRGGSTSVDAERIVDSKQASTSRPRARRVCATVIVPATKRFPVALCQPNLFLRQSSAGQTRRSAGLLVGGTPSVRANVEWHRKRLCTSWHSATAVPVRGDARTSRGGYVRPVLVDCVEHLVDRSRPARRRRPPTHHDQPDLGHSSRNEPSRTDVDACLGGGRRSSAPSPTCPCSCARTEQSMESIEASLGVDAEWESESR
jgi:hypothetical protein